MNNRIAGFDGLRALAVLAVYAQHKMPSLTKSGGHLGVLLFFALSGFLIIRILHVQRESIEAGQQSFRQAFRRFFLRRTLRIFPIYYLTLAVLTLLAVTGISTIDWDPQGQVFHMLYLSNIYIGMVKYAFLGQYSHLWSLSIEEQFYLLSAPLYLVLHSRHHIALCCIIIVVGAVTFMVSTASGASEISLGTSSLINFAALAAGGLAGLYYGQSREFRHSSVLLLLFTALFLALPRLAPMIPAILGWGMEITCAVMIVFLVACAQQSRIVRLLELPPLQHLGRISYAFYLYHNFIVFTPFAQAGIGFKIANHLAQLLLLVLLAHCSWKWLEKPIMAIGHRKFKV